MFASRFRRLRVLPVLTAIGLASVGAVGLGSVGAVTSAHARSISAKPTIVLVHGAFADSSGFDGVINRLRHDGYPVLAAPNPLSDFNPTPRASGDSSTASRAQRSSSATPTAAP